MNVDQANAIAEQVIGVLAGVGVLFLAGLAVVCFALLTERRDRP